MPGYRNNLAFHPTRGLTPQSEMSESDDQQPLRTEEGPRAHACEPRADANNQNEFAVGIAHIKEAFGKLNDMVTDITMLLIAVAIKNILFPH